MLWPLQNIILYKSNILIKNFISMFLRLHAIEVEIRLSRIFQKKIERPIKKYTSKIYKYYF